MPKNPRKRATPRKHTPRRQLKKDEYTEEGYKIVSHLPAEREVYTPRRIAVKPFRPPATVTIKNPERFADVFFRCIHMIEGAGWYATMDGEATSCLDSILNINYLKENRTTLHVHPGIYEGKNDKIREMINTGVGLPRTYYQGGHDFESDYKRNGLNISLFDAILYFFINNPDASPEQNMCTVEVAGVPAPVEVNCISHVFELERLYSGYSSDISTRMRQIPTMDSVIEIVNRGSSCTLPDVIGYGHTFSGAKVGSCMEALLDTELIKFGNYRTSSKDTIASSLFTTVLDKYDWSIEGSKGVPAIQTILDGVENNHREYAKNFLLSIMMSQDLSQDSLQMRRGFINVLSREYDFTVVDFPKSGGKSSNKYSKGTKKRTTAVDYSVETGSSVAPVIGLLSNDGTFSTSELCRYGDSAGTCISKFLSKMMPRAEGSKWYSKYDTDVLSSFLPYANLTDFSKSVVEGDCTQFATDKEHPETCIDMMITSYSSGTSGMFKNMLQSILSTYPPNDMMCVVREGGKSRTTNCLDKIMSGSNYDLREYVLRSGILLDRPDCSDIYGNQITCVDKISQNHEVWLYLVSRKKQLEGMRAWAESEYRNTKDKDKKEEFQNIYVRTGEDLKYVEKVLEHASYGYQGFDTVTSQYDIGGMKMHPPGKEFSTIKPIIEAEMRDITEFGEKIQSMGATQHRANYIKELMKSVTSDTAQRDIQIAPRLFKLYDATKGIRQMVSSSGFLTDIGLYWIYEGGKSITLNMFECKDGSTGKTISCMQKGIDVAKEIAQSPNMNSSTRSKAYNIYSMKDITRPNLCQSGETKMSCVEYAINNLGISGGTEGYVSLLARKDFRNLAKVPIKGKDGSQTTLGEEVCKSVSLTGLANYLVKVRGKYDVTNSNACLNGMALDLYSQCKCTDAHTPLERRACVDKLCFDTYVGVHPESTGDDAWYFEYINSPDLMLRHYRYNNEDDAFGISGVYDITYNPASYSVTDTERFNYAEVVKQDIVPVLSRMKGLKLGKYDGKSNVRISKISVIPPAREDDDFTVDIEFEGTGQENAQEVWSKVVPVSDIFIRGGLLNREDARTHVVKYRRVEEAIEKISTRRKGGASESRLKLVLSNRPADFLRASTCQNWSSCMALPGGGYNTTMFQHMALGGYIAYIASDELAPNWFARMSIDPGTDLPEEPNNAFAMYPVYGLTAYKSLLQDAVKVVLHDSGYNLPGTMTKGETPMRYIDGYRIGGQKSHKTRISMLWKEIRADALQRCLEKISNGETVTLTNTRKNSEQTVITEGSECEVVGRRLQDGGFRPTDMARAGLVGKDLIKSLRLMRNMADYHDGETQWEITEAIINNIRERISVDFASPLSVTGRGKVGA